MAEPVPISNVAALRLLRENADDKTGRDPRPVPGCDWDRIDELLQGKRPPPGAFTAADLAARQKLTIDTADKRLRRLVGGTMESGVFVVDGHRRIYFWLKESDQ